MTYWMCISSCDFKSGTIFFRIFPKNWSYFSRLEHSAPWRCGIKGVQNMVFEEIGRRIAPSPPLLDCPWSSEPGFTWPNVPRLGHPSSLGVTEPFDSAIRMVGFRDSRHYGLSTSRDDVVWFTYVRAILADKFRWRIWAQTIRADVISSSVLVAIYDSI